MKTFPGWCCCRTGCRKVYSRKQDRRRSDEFSPTFTIMRKQHNRAKTAFASTSCVECERHQLHPCQLLSWNFPYWRLQVWVCGGQNHVCLWWLGLCLASLHPGHFCVSISRVSLCLCILNMCPGHLCILDISASHHPGHLHLWSRYFHILKHPPIPGVEAARRESRGTASPAQLGCCRVSARAAESSSSQMLSLLSKSLAASFS